MRLITELTKRKIEQHQINKSIDRKGDSITDTNRIKKIIVTNSKASISLNCKI